MLEQAKSDAASTEAIHTMFKTMTDVILPLNTDLLQGTPSTSTLSSLSILTMCHLNPSHFQLWKAKI